MGLGKKSGAKQKQSARQKNRKARQTLNVLNGLRSSPPRKTVDQGVAEQERWEELTAEYLHGEWLLSQYKANDWERRYGHAAKSWLELLRLAMEACESGKLWELEEYLR